MCRFQEYSLNDLHPPQTLTLLTPAHYPCSHSRRYREGLRRTMHRQHQHHRLIAMPLHQHPIHPKSSPLECNQAVAQPGHLQIPMLLSREATFHPLVRFSIKAHLLTPNPKKRALLHQLDRHQARPPASLYRNQARISPDMVSFQIAHQVCYPNVDQHLVIARTYPTPHHLSTKS